MKVCGQPASPFDSEGDGVDLHWPEFNYAWEKLAARGECDQIGGVEYRRILREWIERASAFPYSAIYPAPDCWPGRALPVRRRPASLDVSSTLGSNPHPL